MDDPHEICANGTKKPMAPLMRANTAEAWLGLENVARAVTFLLPCVNGMQSHPLQYNWTSLLLPSSAICCPRACCRLKQEGIDAEATVMFNVLPPVLPGKFDDGDDIWEIFGEEMGKGEGDALGREEIWATRVGENFGEVRGEGTGEGFGELFGDGDDSLSCAFGTDGTLLPPLSLPTPPPC